MPLLKRLGRYLCSIQPWNHNVNQGFEQWAWPSKLLQGTQNQGGKKEWAIGRGSRQMLSEAVEASNLKADEIEDTFRGCIRRLPRDEALV